MLLSLHVRKAGGSTFRGFLVNTYGKENIHFYYDPKTGAPPESKILDVNNQKEMQRIKETKNIIHGHFAIKDLLPYFPDAICITFMRTPVERFISNYHHLYRDKAFKQKGFKKETMTLEEFAHEEDNYYHNIMIRDVGSDLSIYKYIGITEELDRSINLFCSMFNIKKKSNIKT